MAETMSEKSTSPSVSVTERTLNGKLLHGPHIMLLIIIITNVLMGIIIYLHNVVLAVAFILL